VETAGEIVIAQANIISTLLSKTSYSFKKEIKQLAPFESGFIVVLSDSQFEVCSLGPQIQIQNSSTENDHTDLLSIECKANHCVTVGNNCIKVWALLPK
jgi:hypothetical protein